ncbi:MAG: hypothetical protein RR007_00980 [Kiritimatiellia bacterium]
MNKVLFAILFAIGCATVSEARSCDYYGSHGYRPYHRPNWGCDYRPPRWGWGMGVSPWGATVGFGTRIGRHGMVGFSMPLYPPPLPEVRETTIIVQQQPQIVQQPIIVQPSVVQQPVVQPVVEVRQPMVLPSYAPVQTTTPRTWVEGYWRVTRTPEGVEGSRIWVPGHWE